MPLGRPRPIHSLRTASPLLNSKRSSTGCLIRVRSKCWIDPKTGCWLWQRARNGKGYAVMTRNSVRRLVHREVLASVLGRPLRKLALHLCGNGHRGCVNPQHLYEGTYHDNAQDRRRHGRHKGLTGSCNPNCKIPDNEIPNIIALRRLGWTQTRIAKHYGVSQQLISGILRGRRAMR